MNELNALRLQNQDLLSRLDQSSLESLDRLNNQIEEQKLINTSLNTKWTTTTDELKQARCNIEKLHFMLQQSEDHILELELCINESNQMHNEDIFSLKTHHTDTLTDITNTHNTILTELTHIKNTEIQQLHEELLIKESHITDCQLQITELTNKTIELDQLVQNLQNELKLGYEQYNQRQQEYEIKINDLIDKNEENLNIEKETTRSITADLDFEKSKRRRIEREKKLLEAELYRNKTQVQVAGTCTTQEVDAALKELKSMEIQLEEAHTEIQYLKSIHGQGKCHDI